MLGQISLFANAMQSTKQVAFKAVVIIKTIKMKNRVCTLNESLKVKQSQVIKADSTIVKASSLTSVSGFLFLRNVQLLSNIHKAHLCY